VSLPAGQWYDFWSGTRVPGGRNLEVDPPLDKLPVYVRAGSIIPQQPVVQNVDETPRGPLALSVYPGPQCHGSLYADDGNTLAYQKGESLHVGFGCTATTDSVAVDISAPTGTYHPWFEDLQLNIYGVSGTVQRVTVDSQPVTGWKVESDMISLPPLKWANTSHHITVKLGRK